MLLGFDGDLISEGFELFDGTGFCFGGLPTGVVVEVFLSQRYKIALY